MVLSNFGFLNSCYPHPLWEMIQFDEHMGPRILKHAHIFLGSMAVATRKITVFRYSGCDGGSMEAVTVALWLFGGSPFE